MYVHVATALRCRTRPTVNAPPTHFSIQMKARHMANIPYLYTDYKIKMLDCEITNNNSKSKDVVD